MGAVSDGIEKGKGETARRAGDGLAREACCRFLYSSCKCTRKQCITIKLIRFHLSLGM